jgi:prophage regulatory protein
MTTPPSEPLLLNVREVASITSLPRASIYEAMKRGTFPKSVRLGAGRVAWHASEVRAWVRALPRTAAALGTKHAT